MRQLLYIPATIAISALSATAQAPSTAAAPAQPAQQEQQSSIQKELAKLNQQKELREAKLQAELAEMKAEIERLKAQRELLAEKQQIADLKQDAEEKSKLREAEKLQQQLKREAAIAKSKAALAESKLDLEKTKLTHEAALYEAEIEALKVAKERQKFSNSKPVYLEKPLKADGTLVISDRRIALNGPISADTGDYVTERIHYYNNKDKKKPIFIVIDDSPGGSVMAGYRILKAMEGSDAPIHVVVKSFAASMAATITTLAEESYAYPNALILHHQISSSYFYTTMNLTQQKEAFEDSKKWWDRLAKPIAQKMGITTDELIKQMYKNNSDGDWVEFATEAQKLKWVNHIVNRIQETALDVNPDSVDSDSEDKKGLARNATLKPNKANQLKETVDSNGKPCIYLPRINPHDVYFLYNPDGYYRLKK